MSDRMLSDEILLGLIKANSGGGGGTGDYNDLKNQPQIGGNTLTGNKTASDLGLVAAETGKGLSANDYTNKDKAIVDGVTAALEGKQDALTAGDYIQFDGNEISVKRDISKEDSRVVVNVYGHNDSVIDVTVTQDGEQISSETYSLHTLSTVNIANVAELYTPRYPFIAVRNLVDSTEHPAGYVEEMWMGSVPRYEQTYIVKAYEDKKLIIQSELDAEIDAIKDGANIDSFAEVESALALKQDATDNNLTTTSKDTTGAINELKSGFTNLDNEVNGDATVYPYADVITIEDAVPANLADCSVKIEPVQDLHGYDKPWVGGAGKNLLETIEIPENTNSGITYSTITDNDDNIIGIKINGTATEDTSVQFNKSFISDGTQYRNCILLSGSYTGSVTHVSYDNNWAGGSPGNIGTPKVLSITTYTRWRISIPSGSTFNNAVFGYIVCATSADTLSYAPYTNICPISGHTESVVTRVGKNLCSELESGTLNDHGLNTDRNGRVRTKYYIRVVEGQQYVLRALPSVSGKVVNIAFNGFTKDDYATYRIYDSGWLANGSYITIPSGVKFVRCVFKYATEDNITPSSFEDVQLELGSTATPYEPYQGKTYTIALGDTIYGGTVDFDSGVMTVDRAMLTLDGTEQGWSTNTTSGGKRRFSNEQLPSLGYTSVAKISASSNIFKNTTSSDYDLMDDVFILRYINGANRIDIMTEQFADVTEWTTFLGTTNMQVLYMLATPTTIQLTPQQIQLLKGTNTLTASTGQISVTVNGVSGSIGAVQEQVNGLAEDVAELDGRLDALDTYVLNTPVKIGKWFDSILYRKVISFGSLPNNNYGAASSGLSNVAIVNIRAFARSANATIMLNYPDCKCYYNHIDDTVVIATSADFSSYTSCYVVLEYYEQPNS